MNVNELSHWQCLLLSLISIQEKASKHSLSLIFNRKSTPKKKTSENISYFKSKSNQVFVTA